MPVIVMASPKGGAGKSTCAVLLATEFVRMGVSVTILDCDPNKSLTRWASRGLPEGMTLLSDVQRSELVTSIREADGDGRIVIVDLKGIASQIVSRAISQADLVIVPMQQTALDAEVGGRWCRKRRKPSEGKFPMLWCSQKPAQRSRAACSASLKRSSWLQEST